MKLDHNFLLANIERHLKNHTPLFPSNLQFIVQTIRDSMGGYDWVGFYWINRENPQELLLGSFVGAPTEHTRIPLNKGICGMAISKGETIVIADVNQAPEYLSCSVNVKSEIVVPIYYNNSIVGEIDIDSHTISRFSPEDTKFIEDIAKILTKYITPDLIYDDCKSSRGS